MTVNTKNTETTETRVEPRYVVAGLDFSEANLVNIQEIENVTLYDFYKNRKMSGNKIVIAIIKGAEIKTFKIAVDYYISDEEFLYGGFEYSGNLADYVIIKPIIDLLSVVAKITDGGIDSDGNPVPLYQCIDTKGKSYMLTREDFANYRFTNVRIDESITDKTKDPYKKVESKSFNIPEYTKVKFDELTALAEAEENTDFRSRQVKSEFLDSLGSYDFKVDWDSQTLLGLQNDIEYIPKDKDFPPVRFIGLHAFEECYIEKLAIPDEIEAIGKSAFQDCVIDEIEIGPNVKRIGVMAFYNARISKFTLNCKHLNELHCNQAYTREINIGPEVNNIEELFYGRVDDEHIRDIIDDLYVCAFNRLKNINIHPDNPYYTSIDGVLYNKDVTKLLHFPACSMIANFEVPDTVQEITDIFGISQRPFWNRENLESIKVNQKIDNKIYIQDHIKII